jgi:hypothetical protein
MKSDFLSQVKEKSPKRKKKQKRKTAVDTAANVDNPTGYPHRLDNSYGVAHSLHSSTTIFKDQEQQKNPKIT